MKKKIRWSAAASAAANARKMLPRLAIRFFKAGRKAAESDEGEVLHKFRLATKRLRYTLEFFEPIYGPGLSQRLSSLRRLQRYLGEISDAHITEGMMSSGRDKNRPEVRHMLAWLARHTRAQRSEFRKYWSNSIDAGDAADRWINYLKRYARG